MSKTPSYDECPPTGSRFAAMPPRLRWSWLAVFLSVIAILTILGRPGGRGPTGPVARVVDGETMAVPLGGRFEIDRTETTIGAFRAFVQATGTVTAAEREGGGFVYEGGWRRMPGWTWVMPFGRPAADDEPAVHVTFDEARAYCCWAGGRLPTDAEWVKAAYTERRADPPSGFVTGRTYPYPTGDSPDGANCLADCGPVGTVTVGPEITRGRGHARVGTTRAGVNGLLDMGGNVWEWTEIGGARAQGTRGGSWWYGAAQMRADAVYTKPREFPAVYIGFRCVRDAP